MTIQRMSPNPALSLPRNSQPGHFDASGKDDKTAPFTRTNSTKDGCFPPLGWMATRAVDWMWGRNLVTQAAPAQPPEPYGRIPDRTKYHELMAAYANYDPATWPLPDMTNVYQPVIEPQSPPQTPSQDPPTNWAVLSLGKRWQLEGIGMVHRPDLNRLATDSSQDSATAPSI